MSGGTGINNVVSLFGGQQGAQEQGAALRVNQALIQGLERLLEDAKRGELVSLVGTGFMNNGDRLSIWADPSDAVWLQMLGSLEAQKIEYVGRVSERKMKGMST